MKTMKCPKCKLRMMRDYVQRPGQSERTRPYMKKNWWCPTCGYVYIDDAAVTEIKKHMIPLVVKPAKPVRLRLKSKSRPPVKRKLDLIPRKRHVVIPTSIKIKMKGDDPSKLNSKPRKKKSG